MSFRSPKSDISLGPFVSISKVTTKRIRERKGVVLNYHHTELERRKKIEGCYEKRKKLNTIIVIKNYPVKECFYYIPLVFPSYT